MSKYCMQCGKEIDDSANNCQFCGASQNYSFDNNPAKKKMDPVVAIVAVISVILVVVIVVANLTIFNNEYKKPIKNIFRLIETGDSDYIDEIFPEYMIDVDDDELEEMASQINSAAEAFFGEDFEISYDIIDKDDIDDDELEELEESIEKKYDENVNVSKGYTVEIEVTLEAGSKENTETTKLKVYKIDGDWCMTENIANGLF